MQDILNINQNVQTFLQNESARNLTNKEFIYAYWKKYDGLKSKINLPTFRRLTDPESIARCRRKVVEKHPLLSPTSVSLVRAKKSKERIMRRFSHQ